MEFKEGTVLCEKHQERKAIGICTVKSCVNKNLCYHCLNSHDGTHNKKILFLDKNYLFYEGSLYQYAKNKREKYLNYLSKLIKAKKNNLEIAKNKLEKTFEIIKNEFIQKLQENKLKLIEKLNQEYFLKDKEDFNMLEIKLKELEQTKLNETNKFKETILNIVNCLSEILPDIETILKKHNIEICNDAKMFENLSFLEINEKGVNTITNNIENEINKIAINSIVKNQQKIIVDDKEEIDEGLKDLFNNYFDEPDKEKDVQKNNPLIKKKYVAPAPKKVVKKESSESEEDDGMMMNLFD